MMARRLARGFSWMMLALIVLLVAFALPASRTRIKALAHDADAAWFDERLQDAMGRFTLGEDWGGALTLRRPQDYAWLDVAGPWPVRIAHALGDSGASDANSVSAMRRAFAAGIRLFEVDISLEDGGELRCAHDPGMARLVQSCTFESLMAELPENTWVVLDIKSDFRATGERIMQALQTNGKARQVIFQLYRPADVAAFGEWQASRGLPGPIVTAYLAHRSVNTVARETARVGIRAFTLPITRLTALSHRPDGMAVFVHPVHDCKAWRTAQDAHVRGIYTRTDTRCDHG